MDSQFGFSIIEFLHRLSCDRGMSEQSDSSKITIG